MANKHPDLVYDTVEERAESIAAAEARGEARGRAEVLAEIRTALVNYANTYRPTRPGGEYVAGIQAGMFKAVAVVEGVARAHAAGVAAPERTEK
jgi:hypothetical protein